MPVDLPVALSPTRVENAARCRRRHVLADLLDRVAVDHEAGAAEFGTVIHAGVGQYWSAQHHGASPAAAAEDALAAVRLEWQEHRPAGDKHTEEMALRMMENYVTAGRLAADLPGDYTIFEHADYGPMVEKRVVLDLGSVRFSFQIDRLVVEQHSGRMAFVDTKTSSRISGRWHKRFDRWLQGKLYAVGLDYLLGKVPDDVVVEGLEKDPSADRPVYKYIPPWSMDELMEAERLLLQHGILDTELLEAVQDADGVVDIDKLVEKAVVHTMFNYDACFAFYKPCPFLEVCTADPVMRVELLHDTTEYEEPWWLGEEAS